MDKIQRIIVKGIVIKDGKVLLVQRKKEGHILDSKWELPGGKIELGESMEDACIREIREETGVISTFKKIEIANYQNIPSGGLLGNHLIIIPIVCNYSSYDEAYSGDHNVREVSWFYDFEIETLDLLDGTKEFLKNVFL